MKVCLIVEGAYPYVTGGVSSWIQQMLTNFKEIEFIIYTLVVDRNEKREFKYNIPKNVIEIREIYLQDNDYILGASKVKFTQKEYEAFNNLLYGEKIDWDVIFNYFQNTNVSINSLLGSKEFLQMTINFYNKKFKDIPFSDFLWTIRSMYLPLFFVLKSKPVEADLYHSISTGYAGIFAAMSKAIYNKPLIISEHGIYTREREEEIIKANWVKGAFKDLWIHQFKKCSTCCYEYADKITALFEGAKQLQVELGCDEDKINVIPNGVDADQFSNIPQKDNDTEEINVGTVLRVTPIKDVKTMINAFHIAKKSIANLKLWIMGPLDEKPEYVEECKQLIQDLGVKDIIFKGKINVKEYIGKMDFNILSSLSEGQPLSILESFAAERPCIATNVGNCAGMIKGDNDNFGDAGIVVPVMNVTKLAEAIEYLGENQEVRNKMGKVGYKRVKEIYNSEMVFNNYRELYNSLSLKE